MKWPSAKQNCLGICDTTLHVSNQNAFDFIERNLVIAPVVKFGCLCLVVCSSRSVNNPVFPGAEPGNSFLRDPRVKQICIDVSLSAVMCRHFVKLSSFLLEPKPGSLSIQIEVLDVHRNHSADTSGAVNHHADQCTVSHAMSVDMSTVST